MRRALVLTFSLLEACGPRNREPSLGAPASKPPTVTRPTRTHAKWFFADTDARPNAQIDLGEKGVFLVGDRGRRWLVSPNGKVAEASELIPQPLVDVQLRGKALLLLGRDGTTYEIAEPLGPIVATHAVLGGDAGDDAPTMFAAGKNAVLGLSDDGGLRRSLDGGTSWTASTLALHPGEEAVGLAANRRGEVLVLLQPQRVLLSTDDGVTFAPIATPGIGAQMVVRDGHDDLWLGGYVDEARLLMGPPRLQATKEERDPLVSPVQKKDKSTDETARRVLAGTRLVTILETNVPDAKQKRLAVSVSPLGQAAPAPFEIEPGVSPSAEVRVAGHEGTVVVATHDADADPPLTRIRRTVDDGKTWELVGSFEGGENGSFHLAVGPDWIVVGELCDEKTNACTAPRAKIGSKPWAPLEVPANVRPDALLFDAAHDRVVVIAQRGDDRLLLESKLAGGPFSIVDVVLPDATLVASGFDAKGDLRLFSTNTLVKIALGKTPTVSKPLYLPFESVDLAVAGDRAYAHSGDHAWESLDGGEHWAEVAAAGPGGEIRCAPLGCVEQGSVRLGWDVNAGDPAPLASAYELPKNTGQSDPPAQPPAAPKVTFQCTPSGAWKKIAGNAPSVGDSAYEGDVRFVSRVFGELGESDTIFVARGAAAPQKTTLLPAAPKETEAKAVRAWTNTSTAGLVTARYSFKTSKPASGGYNPVDVELGWYSAVRAKSGKVKLPNLPAFRVGRAASSALAEIVDGGVLFLPNTGDAPLHFVTDAGKITRIPRPPQLRDAPFDQGVKIGDRIVLSATADFVHVGLASTSDYGKTWTTATWTIGARSTLAVVGGKPTLFVRDADLPHAFLAFDAVTPDPPILSLIDAEKLDVATAALTTCTSKAGGVLADVPPGEDTAELLVKVSADGEAYDLALDARVLRIGEGGDACVTSLVAGGADDKAAAILDPRDLAHGWLVRNGDEGSEYRVISCKL